VVLDATMPPVGVTPPVDTRARYLETHIPGAVFFDIDDLSDHATALPHMLPAEEEFSEKMAAMGVGKEKTIVVYEQEGVYSAPRAWWMLRSFGAKHVYLLDGGLKAWMDAGFPTEAGLVVRRAAEFHAVLDRGVVRDFADVQRMIDERGQMLDARSRGRFTGELPEPRPGISSGHMPGATSVPFLELVEDGRMMPAEKLRDLFAAKGLEIAGAKDVSLYDGSWAEYAQRREAVIVKDV
jgi:thiosulfate/3-mercaptopyruvate sulfurtransferase